MRNRGNIRRRVSAIILVSLMLVVLCVMTASAEGETADPTANLYARHYVVHEGYTEPEWKTVRAKFTVNEGFDTTKARARLVKLSDESVASDLFEVEFIPGTGTITGTGEEVDLMRIRPKVGATGTTKAKLMLEYDADGDGTYTLVGFVEVSLEVTDKTLLTEVGCTIAKPVVGQGIDTTVVSSDSEKYTAKLVGIVDMDTKQTVYKPADGITGEGFTYAPKTLYSFQIYFTQNAGYRLLEDTVYLINGVPSGRYSFALSPTYFEHIDAGRTMEFATGKEGGDWHSVTVNNGRAFSYLISQETDSAACGSEITLMADSMPENYFFAGWVVNKGEADIADSAKTRTTFVMGDEDVEITAVFKELIKYDVWIGGTQITNANMANIFGGSGTPSATASYDTQSNTMTVKLNNARLDGVCNDAVIWSDGINLVLDIEGGLIIRETGNKHLYAIFTEGAGLTINGSLTAESLYSSVIACDRDLTVNGDLTLTGKYCAINVSGNVVIDGNVTAEIDSDAYGPAIFSGKGSITITGDVDVKNSKAGGGISAVQGTVTIRGNIVIESGSGGDITAKEVDLKGTDISITGQGEGIMALGGAVTIEADGNVTVTASDTDNFGISAAAINISGSKIGITGAYGLQSDGGDIIIVGDTEITATRACIRAINTKTFEAYTVSVKGDLELTASNGSGIWAGNIDITGNLTANTGDGCIDAMNAIRIEGDVNATVTGTQNAMTAVHAPTVEMVSGTWTLSGTKTAIDASPDGIKIPATHGILLPENGKLAEISVGSTTRQTVTDADGNPAKEVKIGPASFSVTVTDNGYGTAKADIGSGIAGTVVTLTATPNEGYRFKEWNILEGGMGKTDDGAIIPGIFIDASNRFTLETKNVKIEAVFEPLPKPEEGGSHPIRPAEEVTYTVVSGDNGSVAQGSDMTITVKRSVADETCINHFTGVQIDGKACAAGDYEAKAGSTVVTLKAATLQKLGTGAHTVTVLFDDGKAETKLTVKEAVSSDNSGSNDNAGTGNKEVQSPKTGETRSATPCVLLILSGICTCGVVVFGRRRRETEA